MTGSNQIQWTEEIIAAFHSKNPVLQSPDFVLQTDASVRGLEAVLLQGPQDDLHTVAYIRHKLFPREIRYSTVEKEALVIK